jgi:hypothetical protein
MHVNSVISTLGARYITLDVKNFYLNKPIGAAPRWHFFWGGEVGVWAKKGVMLRGLRISEKKEILRKPTVL